MTKTNALKLQAFLIAIFALVHATSASADSELYPPADPAAFQGVWQMDGYALVMVVNPREVIYYDVTAVSCIESDRKPVADFAKRFSGGLVRRTASEAVLRDSEQPYVIRPLPALPKRCENGGTVGNDPVLNFETFWHYMKENYAGSKVRGIDWDGIYAKYRPQVDARTTPDALIEIYRAILTKLDDIHVFYSNGKQGPEARSIVSAQPSGLRRALFIQNPGMSEDEGFKRDDDALAALNQLIRFDLLKGRYSSALNSKFDWGWAAPGIGYLNIKLMYQLFEKQATDPRQVTDAVNATLDRILTDFSPAKALIIDIRQDRGGADAVGNAIAARFADRRVCTTGRAKTAQGFTEPFQTCVDPMPKRFARPVYLLISKNTASAGEEFAIMMKEYSNVTLVGEPTHGSLSDILFKKLPDGSFLGIADMQLFDAHGVNFEGRGVPPKITARSYDPANLIAGYLDAIDVAISLANKGSSQHDSSSLLGRRGVDTSRLCRQPSEAASLHASSSIVSWRRI